MRKKSSQNPSSVIRFWEGFFFLARMSGYSEQEEKSECCFSSKIGICILYDSLV